ncbi:hypothetical protein IW262DRAFT_1468632 [Armillaria fumosa]|nr:hypothetical protein IW262DRAFT_1468632 [Armillaria fumosa]
MSPQFKRLALNIIVFVNSSAWLKTYFLSMKPVVWVADVTYKVQDFVGSVRCSALGYAGRIYHPDAGRMLTSLPCFAKVAYALEIERTLEHMRVWTGSVYINHARAVLVVGS